MTSRPPLRSVGPQNGTPRAGRALERLMSSLPLGSAPSPRGWPADSERDGASGPTASEVSAQIVGLLRDRTGRGPTKAKCTITSDFVLVTLSESLTTLETGLLEGGHGELVAQLRNAVHDQIGEDATRIVEDLTRQNVSAYMTAQRFDPDFELLIFYLGP